MSSPSANGSGPPPFRITGGAGPYETAAIAAVVEVVAEQERRASAPVRGRLSNWVLASRNGSGPEWRLPRRAVRPVSALVPPPPPGSPAAAQPESHPAPTS